MPAWLALACVATLAACMGAEDAPSDERPLREVGTAGVTIALPEGWRTLPIDDGNIVDPVTRVAVASGPLREPIPGCETQITRYAPRPDGVALVVVEWNPSGDADPPPRPPRLGPALALNPGELECFAAEGGTVQFVERGRILGVYALVGSRADPRLSADVRRAADSLRIDALG
jgi:hypothetical protein